LVKKNLKPDTLAVLVLNVGDGDALVVKFPEEAGKKACAVIDCYNARKTIAALERLAPDYLPLVCATHPHFDHNRGLRELIEWCLSQGIEIKQFWDSGFRHVSKTHYDLIRLLQIHPEIQVVYPTSGYECVIHQVAVRVLSPSIHLKNRYDTFGTNINNASIVIKLEYPPRDIAPFYLDREQAADQDLAEEQRIAQNTIILGGDAQFDAWAKITDEFPELVRTENRGQMLDPAVIKHQPLHCQVLKVPHHMSKHGISLEVLETLQPQFTIGSLSDSSTHGFPHELTVMAIEDIQKKKLDKGIRFTGHPQPDLRGGSVVTIMRGGSSKPLVYTLGDKIDQMAPL
jgi:beta-lactamase superfamily II metal-dependent hydrolase